MMLERWNIKRLSEYNHKQAENLMKHMLKNEEKIRSYIEFDGIMSTLKYYAAFCIAVLDNKISEQDARKVVGTTFRDYYVHNIVVPLTFHYSVFKTAALLHLTREHLYWLGVRAHGKFVGKTIGWENKKFKEFITNQVNLKPYLGKVPKDVKSLKGVVQSFRKKDPRGRQINPTTLKCLEYIIEHYRKGAKAKDIAKLFGKSVYTVRRIISQFYTPLQKQIKETMKKEILESK